jgi:hypothetical protein
MFSLVGIQAKLAAAGAAVLAVLALWVRLQAVKNQRDRAVVVAETLKARHHTVLVQRKIKREEEKRLVTLKGDIEKEVKKDVKDFKGLDNLSNPDDF